MQRSQAHPHPKFISRTEKRDSRKTEGPGLQGDMPYVDSDLGGPSSSIQCTRELMGRIPGNLIKGKYLNRASGDMGSLRLFICSFTDILIDGLLLAGHHLGF